MNSKLWITQALLVAFSIMPGSGKNSNSKQQHIADGHIKSAALIIPTRILGILEWLGCVGIILPCLANVAPILTPRTAVCFCIIMMGGIVLHSKRDNI